jgi:hypothetical protein
MSQNKKLVRECINEVPQINRSMNEYQRRARLFTKSDRFFMFSYFGVFWRKENKTAFTFCFFCVKTKEKNS